MGQERQICRPARRLPGPLRHHRRSRPGCQGLRWLGGPTWRHDHSRPPWSGISGRTCPDAGATGNTSRPARQFPLNELLLQGSGRYNAPMPWSHRVLPLPAFASRRNRPLPGKAAPIAGYRLPRGPHYASDETCNPTGKPSKSCFPSPSDRPATRPGSSVAAERLGRSQKVLLKGLPTSLSTGNPLGWSAPLRPPFAPDCN